MKFLIAVFLPVFLFIPTSPFINFGDFCQSPRLLYPSFLLFWSKFVSLPVYSALPFYLKLESTGITMHKGFYYDCSCHKNEKKKKKKKSESFFNYDAIYHQWLLCNSSSFFFFAVLVSLYDVIRYDVINVKNFCEIFRYFF